MKKVVGLLTILACLGLPLLAQAEVTINGAGASFPYPVYAKWAHKYYELNKVKINYQSIGSGGGIAQIKAKTVDFGGSDDPLKPENLQKDNLVQFPTLMGGVVPIINLKGVDAGQITLSSEVLADIFLAKIKNWNDPAIVKLNPKVKLPNQAITVVHRADGSGTTWIFTNYLSKVSKEWKEKVGNAKSVSWPTGVGAKGNEGVANNVKQVEGGIGYVEYAYATINKIPHANLINRSGKAVAPGTESFSAAAAAADWKTAPGFYMVLTDLPGEKTWPIVGATFILVQNEQPDPDKAKTMLKFFEWCYKHGDAIAEELHYVPMPDSVVGIIAEAWTKEIKSGNKPVWP
ncbi:phosphate ABC transporter substrate-binding protein PstS [Desulfobacca acetoxidans]|uniref:Phosphate-binding protein n=1 Tax=Desulfobacca acetoxidans (strain ATCC 700848 / DSM 11109 / ASRB2) TaxID=880072 RepID=F2NDV6_DESAR|nr:phosphate ABC transporter substrate-binding protein PstS [Desulfobacca acetoxidans]AEB10453.1 phosphate ABC transporter, periplasmic phosphate-binding protein [Desulfobacca acetoxidans DSM 11109]HAY21613.1 phosphate ABC transporter substrate-binding protein PstS [Desulfobacterales bacterium]